MILKKFIIPSVLILAVVGYSKNLEAIIEEPIKQKEQKKECVFLNPDKDYLTEKELNECINLVYKNIENPEIISPNFIRKIIDLESNKNRNAIGPFNEKGLMQLKGETWEEIEKEISFNEKAFDPYENIKVGVNYLKWIQDYCKKEHLKWDELSEKDKLIIIAAAYNGGISRLKENGWNIKKMPIITKEYIKKINSF
jgi:hypothetical protein